MLMYEYSADASDRWALPSQAVDTLVDYCLKEDQDEVVKHYAVKVCTFMYFVNLFVFFGEEKLWLIFIERC